MKYTKHILFFFFHFLLIQINAQQPAHYIIGKEALAGLDLYSIIQDDTDNSVWITTENGIFNYNGKDFTHQVPKNIASTSLFGLTKDTHGTIYCFNLTGQIYKIENKKLQLFYTIPSSLIHNKIDVCFNEKNELIILSANKLFKVTNHKKIHFIEKQNVKHILKQQHHFFYVKKENNQTHIIQRQNDTSKVYLTTNFSLNYDYLINFKENLYALEENKLTFLPNLKETTLSFSNKNFWNLKPYATKNELWFCHSKNGVYKIEDVNTKQQTIPLLFKNYFISGAMTDAENNIWLLTFDKGIIFIPNIHIENLNTSITSITKFDNTIFLGNNDGTIFKLKNKQLQPYATTQKPIKNLAVFNDISFTNLDILHKKRKIQSINFTRHIQYINDSIFHLSTSNGLTKYNRNTNTQKHLTSKRVYSSYCNSNSKKIWLASSTGLQQLVNDSIYNLYHNKKRIMAKTIVPVKNELWVASNQGIIVFKNDSINRVLSTKNGLLNNRVIKLTYEEPNVYIATQKGVQQYNLQTQKITNFTQANGLNGAVKNLEILNDTTYLVTTNGLLQFTFNDIKTTSKTYKTTITNVYVNGSLSIKNNAVLQPEENNIEFSFLTPTFTYKNNTTYNYKLNGFEKEFTTAKNNQNFVKFSNLPAGSYTFEVQSYSNHKKNAPAYFSFTITPYWYETKWFTFTVIGLGLLMIYIIYRIRLNAVLQKKDKEQMKKRLAESSLTSLKAQMNPHFMFNAINSIQSLVLLEKRTEAYRYLTKLADLIRNNLNMSDVSFVTLQDEIKLTKQYLELEKLRFEDTFNYQVINFVEDLGVKIPSMIIQPFVENAIKHGLLHKTTNRKLSVSFFTKKEFIICEIVDNGIGRKASEEIQKKRHYKSFSTNAINKRFDILKEYYKIEVGFEYEDLYENNQPSGTKVTIKIICLNEFN